MIYLDWFSLPDENAEYGCLSAEKRTIFSSCYPFKIFPPKQFCSIRFKDITVFYGSNGSGKTTLLNIIGEKANVIRHSEYSSSGFYERYLELCSMPICDLPDTAQFLSSDDVFDYMMNMRYLNKDIDEHRDQLIKGYHDIRHKASEDESYRRLHGLDDYDRWREVSAAALSKKTESKYVKERLARNIDMYSNGETAFRFFVEHIDRDSLYLIDEPENSLSIQKQLELKDFIEASAKYHGCQFILSTHSPVLLSLSGALIYDLDSTPVCTKSWVELDNVRAYFDFFMSHRDEF